MKKIFSLLLTVILAFSIFSACSTAEVPKSKESESYSLKYYTTFEGLSLNSIHINKDLSGYLRFTGSNLEESLKKLKDSVVDGKTVDGRITKINNSAYSSSNKEGYELIYLKNEPIVTIKENSYLDISFVNINYLKGDITVSSLSEYLSTSFEEADNNFKDLKGLKSSIKSIENPENYKIVLVSNYPSNYFPIIFDGSTILCYKANNAQLEGNNKISFKPFNAEDTTFKVVIEETNTPLALIIVSAVLALILIAVVLYKYVFLPRR